MENQVVEPEVNTDQLRQEILAEKKGSASEGKKPWEVRMEQDHPEMVKEATKKKEEKEYIEEVKEVEETPKEEPNSEEQQAETESAPVEEQPEEEAQPAEAKKDTAQDDAYIAEYAKNSGLSVDDAKEEVTKLRAISAKYGNDPVKLAKAYREVQSAYDKQKVTASSNVNPAVAAIAANPRAYIVGKVKENAEKLVAEFRQENPARTRDMDDEQVTEEIVERGTNAIKDQIRGYEIQLKQQAATKREEFINGIPESDRRYLPEIKPVLEKLPDHQVVGSTFNFSDLVRWAKGGMVDKLVKEAEDRIHQQYASKDRKIVGEISKPSQTTKVKQTQEQSKSAGMSKWHKDQALQMFASANMTDDEKFEAYLDVTKKKK